MKELAKALSSVSRAVGVGLGGSRGLGLADENSDYDFVLFRSSGEMLSVQEIIDTIKQVSGVEEIRVNAGFVSAQLAGRKFEVFQKDLSAVTREISMAREGKFRWSIRALFPHGDVSTGLISHIVNLELCSEKYDSVTTLRRLAEPYPPLLMHSLVNTFLRHATISVMHAGKIKNPQDLQYMLGLFSGFIFYTNIIIFSINKMYPVIERGGSRLIATLPLRPQNHEQRVMAAFQSACSGSMQAAAAEFSALLEELRVLVHQALESQKIVAPA